MCNFSKLLHVFVFLSASHFCYKGALKTKLLFLFAIICVNSEKCLQKSCTIFKWIFSASSIILDVHKLSLFPEFQLITILCLRDAHDMCIILLYRSCCMKLSSRMIKCQMLSTHNRSGICSIPFPIYFSEKINLIYYAYA